jgi:hypothetical protein
VLLFPVWSWNNGQSIGRAFHWNISKLMWWVTLMFLSIRATAGLEEFWSWLEIKCLAWRLP